MNESAQKIISESKQPRWTRRELMAKFYPIHEKVLKKEKPKITGFKWAFKTPSSPTAEEIVSQIQEENLKIKHPRFDGGRI